MIRVMDTRASSLHESRFETMPDQAPLLIAVGIVAGIFSGLFGIGGGVVIVPALTIFLGFTVIEGVATSLAALLLPVGIFAVIAYDRADLLDRRAAGLIAVGLLITSALGARGALELNAINPDVLRQVYGTFLLYMSWRFTEPRQWLREFRRNRDKDATPPVPHPAPIESPHIEAYVFLIIGLIAGIASGMFGIGGGAVIVPALVEGLRFDQKRAVGTSLGALLLPVALPAVLAYQADGVLDIPVAVFVAIGLLGGAIIGATIALKLPSATVKRLYGLFLIFVGVRFIFFG
jgi:hypothetical protein